MQYTLRKITSFLSPVFSRIRIESYILPLYGKKTGQRKPILWHTLRSGKRKWNWHKTFRSNALLYFDHRYFGQSSTSLIPCGRVLESCVIYRRYILFNIHHAQGYPVNTARKLNVHKTFRRRPGRLLNVLSTFNLRPVSTR